MITLDDRTGAYLERIAAWLLTTDLQREQAIDHELVTHLDIPTDDR